MNLLTAWEAWDQAPGDVTSANRLEDAVREAAARLQMSGTELREAMSNGLIAGLTRRQVLTGLGVQLEQTQRTDRGGR